MGGTLQDALDGVKRRESGLARPAGLADRGGYPTPARLPATLQGSSGAPPVKARAPPLTPRNEPQRNRRRTDDSEQEEQVSPLRRRGTLRRICRAAEGARALEERAKGSSHRSRARIE